MFTTTAGRVPRNTAAHVNARIWRQTMARVSQCAARGPAAINRRLRELDREWDIERVLEANASAAVIFGVSVAAVRGRRWLLFPAAVGGFLLQHAVQGWCPPLAIWRRLGVRTAEEISQERYALKALRGDFEELPQNIGAYDRPALEAVVRATAP